jgi:hypothetical protein
MSQAYVYVLKNSRGQYLSYNPAEGLIFIGPGDGVFLSQELGFPSSARRTPKPSHVFTIDEMRDHYRARLKEGFRPERVEKHFLSDPPRARSAEMPEDFEYGFTDT